MRHVYDVFEKFPDGSTLWRASVTGRFEAERKSHELAELSENKFFFIDIQAEDFLPTFKARAASSPLTNRAVAG